MRIDQPRPLHALRRRHFVAEHVEPAADYLTFDLLLIHPFQARWQIAERLRHWPRRFAAGKREAETAAVFDQADRGKVLRLRADRLKETRRHQMGVTVDDHFVCSCDLRCWASAMASPMAEIRIGSLSKEIPSGATQSLTAAAMAAGAPR